MLGVDHEHHVQQVGLLLGVVGVRADHPQEVLRRGEVLLRPVDVQGAPVKVVALHRVSVGHDAGEGPDEFHRLEEHVLDGGVVGIVVVGV